nr:TonB-dependent receptor [Methylomarinum sp. Ch1-1]MDP4522631.1 TonB-dependent receptor [Methylomarinum sp. Ch1-1]
MINIITTDTAHDQGGKASFRAGSNDYYRGMGRYGGSWRDLSYRLSFLHQQDDGLEGLYDARRVDALSSRFDYRLTDRDVLQYNFGYSEDKSNVGDKGDPADPGRSAQANLLSQSFRWTHLKSADEQLVLRLTHIRREKDERFESLGMPIDNLTLTERLDFELQHVFQPFDQARMMWGVGSRLDRTRLPLWLGDGDDKSNVLYRVFGNIEWTFLDDFILNLGALLEKNAYTDIDVSPKIALNYLWSDQHSFRVMLSRASRMPTIGEQNLDVQKTVHSIIPVRVRTERTLKPVEVISVEAGHHGQFFDHTLTTDIKLAHQRFRRLTQFVLPNASEPVLEYTSANVANSLNAELQLDYQPNQQTLLHMGYSWINIDHDDGSHIDYAASAPHHTANILASYRFTEGWQTSVAYYYRGAMQYLRTPAPIGAFQRLDLIVQKSFKLADKQTLNLAVVHQNNLGSNDEFLEGEQLSDETFVEVSYRFE